MLFIFAVLSHSNMLSPSLGTFAIILLAVLKIWKFKPGIIISIFCIFAMALVYLWQWVDRHFIEILSGAVSSKPELFIRAFSESVILTIIVWLYRRLLNSIHLRLSPKWFVKKSYLLILQLLFYFQLFLVFFLAIAFLMQKAHDLTHLTMLYSGIVGGVVALVAAMVLAIIYFSNDHHDEKKRHLHKHHHRTGTNLPLKNSGVD